jgi:hypothetical protein
MVRKLAFYCALITSIQLSASELAYTYDDVQILKQANPEVANAFLKGVASATYVFRVLDKETFTFCPPRGTRIDRQLVELVVDTEVRIHNAPRDEWYHELVRKGFKRTYPCD